MSIFVRRTAKKAITTIRSIRTYLVKVLMQGGKNPQALTSTQQNFIKWNSERLNIPLVESKRRYLDSWKTFNGGHEGPIFKMYGAMSDRLYKVFADNNEEEIFEVYRFHSPRHFLRMLTYPERKWNDDSLIVRQIGNRTDITILDFGCGLAQQSRTLAEFLSKKGNSVRLILADIPTLRKDFLIWLCNNAGIEMEYINCTINAPVPDLPPCDVCFQPSFLSTYKIPCIILISLTPRLLSMGC